MGPVQDKPPERWYQIEMILFRHRHGVDPIDAARPPVQLPDLSDAMPLLGEIPEFEDEPTSATTIPIAFQQLPENQLSLTGIFRRLARATEVEPLTHVGWRQPSFGIEQSRRIRITDLPPIQPGDGEGVPVTAEPLAQAVPAASPDGYVPRFDGAARLRIGRYLVFDADFVFVLDDVPIRLVETRRLLFGELHYFDHPDAGLLVLVTPYVIDGNNPVEAVETDVDDTIVNPLEVPIDELD